MKLFKKSLTQKLREYKIDGYQWECPICAFTTGQESSYKLHMETHEEPKLTRKPKRSIKNILRQK